MPVGNRGAKAMAPRSAPLASFPVGDAQPLGGRKKSLANPRPL